MGTWNLKLYGNDTTCDVRDTYKECLRLGMSDEEAYDATYKGLQELIGTDEEPLFWFALADTQWRLGRLSPLVKQNALKFLNGNKNDFLFLDELSEKQLATWNETLRTLTEQLNSPMLPYKKFSVPRPFESNHWNIGDLYAFRFPDDYIDPDFRGKYMVLHKIGVVGYGTSFPVRTIDYYPVLQCYNKVFSVCPEISDIENVGLLSLNRPELVYSVNPNMLGTPEDRFISGTWIEADQFGPRGYPEKQFTFIGNIPPTEKWRGHGSSCWSCTWKKLGDDLSKAYKIWKEFNTSKSSFSDS